MKEIEKENKKKKLDRENRMTYTLSVKKKSAKKKVGKKY